MVLSPWIVWTAIRKGKYREGFGPKFLGSVPVRTSGRPCIWLHAVSVGEVNVLRSVIQELSHRHAGAEIVISTTTKAGFELARKLYEGHSVFYCPLDFSWAVRRAMARIRPSLFVLAELELWPNLIAAAKEQGAAVAIINGRLSDNSFKGYRRGKLFIQYILRKIDCIAAQDETTAERFLALGASPSSVMVSGSMKYDGAETDRENERTQKLKSLFSIEENNIVFLAGSTQSPEEEIALQVFAKLEPDFQNLKLILVPRHPDRFEEVASMLERSGSSWARRSQLSANDPPAKILLVDTIGELGAWWGAADIGFVGGSFGSRGGQNMIEPAAYGIATCFGPNTRNFRDIVAALLREQAAIVVQDQKELAAFVLECLSNPSKQAEIGQRASRFVQSQFGATKRTCTALDNLLPKASVSEKQAFRKHPAA